MKNILTGLKVKQSQAIFNLTLILNREGMIKSDTYLATVKHPNIIGLMIFLCKRKGPVETAISDKAFAKYYNHSISYI